MEGVAPEYDFIVLGTGLTECVLSGVLSVKGYKVLHIDRNPYYGGESASVNIETLFKKYGNIPAGQEPWKKYGRTHDWNIDLVPKLLMSNGDLSSILASTNVHEYVKFTSIAGSYVHKGNDVNKVPSSAAEALRSPLLGLFEKRRAKKFLEWVGEFDAKESSTHAGLDLSKSTMKDVYDKFGLEEGTRDFIGHAMALYQSDDYLDVPKLPGEDDDSDSLKARRFQSILETIDRIRLYVNSMGKYGGSPYIYPLYGLGELPQGFARLSAIYGGTYMLNTSIDEILYDADGKVSGIKATMREPGDGSVVMNFETKTKKIIADPSYFPEKVEPYDHLLKAICILKHPIPKTDSSDSLQLIIPQSQVNQKKDTYIAMVSSTHCVCPKGYYIAIVSKILEDQDNWHAELNHGFKLLGDIEERFMGPPAPLYRPKANLPNDNIFISKSYDATTHFETTTENIREIYKQAVGEELVVDNLKKISAEE
ncbi:hypothetical protein DTO217A2_4032 [Paecilomyces variotii]|nr:hypothetical protein DTO217A2_4032 [Paecilomyces variotii]